MNDVKIVERTNFLQLERNGDVLRCMKDRTNVCSSRCVGFFVEGSHVFLQCGHETICLRATK